MCTILWKQKYLTLSRGTHCMKYQRYMTKCTDFWQNALRSKKERNLCVQFYIIAGRLPENSHDWRAWCTSGLKQKKKKRGDKLTNFFSIFFSVKTGSNSPWFRLDSKFKSILKSIHWVNGFKNHSVETVSEISQKSKWKSWLM